MFDVVIVGAGVIGGMLARELSRYKLSVCLLEKEIVLLEGLVLSAVPEGHYLLNAAPLNLAGADGAPCRAWLIPMEELRV